MMVDPLAPFNALAVLVNQTQDLASKDDKLPPGRSEQLVALAHRIGKIRDLENGSAKKRVGVFGAPNRGKSTLLNTLLGGDVLPMAQVPLSTTTIEIEQDSSVEQWRLVINHASGRIESRDCESTQEVAELLERFGSRRGGAEPAERLRLKGAFPNCRILGMGGVLMDTPGAEVAFGSDERLEAEARRAVEALGNTHVVLFCIRADQVGSRSDNDLYEKHIRILSPVHVVTMKDKWPDDPGYLVDEVFKQYGLTQANPILFSAVEARSSETRATSGIDELESMIERELEKLSSEAGLIPCLRDYELAIEDYPRLRPHRIHFLNLYHAVENQPDGSGDLVLARMNAAPEFWKT